MKKNSIASVVAASFIITVPISAAADLKDALFGAAVGAIIQKEVSKNKRSSSKSTAQRKAGSASLNSQYTRAERIQVQTAFRDLGYPIGSIDGVLGKNSRRIIGQYQAGRGEPQTGQLTRAQYVALVSQVSGPGAVFASRPLVTDEVRMLQHGLQTLGYYTGRLDGSNGPSTRGALNAFLHRQGVMPAQATPVQGLVMARNAAGLPTPPYLQQEAGAQGQVQQPNPFGAPNGQRPGVTGFGAPVQQPVQGQGQFVSAPAAQQQLFGAPQQQAVQPQVQQPLAPQTTTTNLFGAPQPQPQTAPVGTAAPAPQQQNLFAPAPQQQPGPVQGTQQGVSTLFAGGGAPPAQGAVQAPQSNLDIFSGTNRQTQPQPNQLAGQ